MGLEGGRRGCKRKRWSEQHAGIRDSMEEIEMGIGKPLGGKRPREKRGRDASGEHQDTPALSAILSRWLPLHSWKC